MSKLSVLPYTFDWYSFNIVSFCCNWFLKFSTSVKNDFSFTKASPLEVLSASLLSSKEHFNSAICSSNLLLHDKKKAVKLFVFIQTICQLVWPVHSSRILTFFFLQHLIACLSWQSVVQEQILASSA